MNLTRFWKYLSCLLILLLLAACGTEQAAQPTATPTEEAPTVAPTEEATPTEEAATATPPPATEEALETPDTGEVFVENVNVDVAGETAWVIVAGELPNNCTEPVIAQQELRQNTFVITLEPERISEDAVCTPALQPFEERFALNISELGEDQYAVNVNGQQAQFELPFARAPLPGETPTVSIESQQIEPGETFTLSADNFPANTDVDIGIGQWRSEYDIIDTTATNDEGQLETSVTLPIYAEGGEQWVALVRFDGTEYISDPFTVLPSEAGLSITPQQGTPGSEIRLQASGFLPEVSVTLNIAGETFDMRPLTELSVDEDGTITTYIELPDYVTAGESIVFNMESSNAFAQSEPFQVTEPDLAQFTRANIYLIALEDDGEMGREVACDDSLVPVEVTFDPTPAPLTASLEELFAIDEEFYGQSGLYNPLHNSDLTIDSIDIEDGLASIYLEGDVSLAGTCDNPRIRAQLRQTALQYETVDEVEYFINGAPLGQAISLRGN